MKSTALPASPRNRILIPILAVLALVIPFLNIGTTAAQAETVDVVVQDSVAVQNYDGESDDGLVRWQRARIAFDWDASGQDVSAGDTFGLELPPELAPVQDGYQFPLLLPDGGTSAGTCTVNTAEGDQPGSIVCEFNDFVENHDNVKGSVWFYVQAVETTEESSVPIQIIGDSNPFEVPLPGDGEIIGEDPGDVPTGSSKQGWFIKNGESVLWSLFVLPPAGSESIELTDVYDSELTYVDDSLKVQRIEATQAAWDTQQWQDVTEGVSVESDPAQHSLDVQVDGTESGYVYRIQYETTVNDPDAVQPGDTFENEYTYLDEEYSEEVVASQEGGGNADGDGRPTPSPSQTPSETPSQTPSETPSQTAPPTSPAPSESAPETPSEETPAPSSSEQPPAPGDNTPEQPGGELPRTGSTFLPLLVMAGGLIAAGAALLMVRRRRTNS